MNDTLNNLPSLGQMIKLIIFLILALIVVSIVVEIVKALVPVLLLAALVIGGYYLLNRNQRAGSAS